MLFSCNHSLHFFLGDINTSHLHQHVEEELLVFSTLNVQLFDEFQVCIRESFFGFLDAMVGKVSYVKQELNYEL